MNRWRVKLRIGVAVEYLIELEAEGLSSVLRKTKDYVYYRRGTFTEFSILRLERKGWLRWQDETHRLGNQFPTAA